MIFVSERFRKDMDSIKLDTKLRNKTISKMRAAALGENSKIRLTTGRFALTAALSFIFVFALVFGLPYKKPSLVTNAQVENLMEGVLGENVEITKDFSREFIDSTSEFSLEMFKLLSEEQNAVYSPTPLYLALGLVLSGAEGNTKKELVETLGKYGVKEEQFNLYYKSLIASLTENNDTRLSIANSIWYDKGFDVKQGFLKTNKTYFDAEAYRLDFSASETPDVINRWVRRVTENKIDKMVDRIEPDVVMMLFSSIYFNGTWKEEFDKDITREGVFDIKGIGKVKTEFMNKRGEMKYIDNEEEQVVLLPYSDGRFAFMAMLPNENKDLRKYISELNKDSISEKLKDFKTDEVTLSLPKFEVQHGKSIKDEIKALGVKDMFELKKADLSGLGIGDIFLSDVKQKTYLRVDERGTEGASTVRVDVKFGGHIEDGISISFNRPFVYAVIDTETKLPIFLGVMDNPHK
jgi:serine protease inhibitor